MSSTPNSLNALLWLLIAAYLIQSGVSPMLGPGLQRFTPLVSILILTGFSVAHGIPRYGVKHLLFFFVLTFAISWGYETLSIETGFPFGHYYYTGMLGPKLGQVPLLIMPAYFSVGYLAWTLAHVLLDRFDDRLRGGDLVLIPVLAAFVMVMWDLCMDPINSTVRRAWVWRDGGAYFGVPIVNFLGWYLCIYSVYQAFALYLRSMDARERPPHLGEHATWSIPAYMYGAVMLNSFVPAVLGDNVQVTSRDGHVWWTGDIHSARALIAIFTMLFFTLLALVRVHRSLGASRLDGGDTD